MLCLSGFELYSRWVPLNELSTISIAFFLHRNCEFLIDFTQRYFISSVTMHTIKTWKKELLVSKIWLLEWTCGSDKLAVVKRAPCNSTFQLKIDLAKAKSESLSSALKNCLVKKKSFVSLRSLENLNWLEENYTKHVNSMSCTPEPAIKSCDTGQRVLVAYFDRCQ